FLQRELRVFVKAFVVDQFADRTLPLVDLLENFPEVRQGGGGFLVECVVFGQFAECPFAFIDFSHNISCLADGGFDFGGRVIQVGHGSQRRLVKCVFVDEAANGAFALGHLGGNAPNVAENGGEARAVLL